MKKIKIFSLIILLTIKKSYSQDLDSLMIIKIFRSALGSENIEENLKILCTQFPGRQAGSEISIKAVEWSKEIMKKMGADTSYLQPITVINWKRKTEEKAFLITNNEKLKLNILSFGPSVGTKGIIKGEIIKVKNINELKELPEEKIKGKIVYFSQSMDSLLPNPFTSYGKVVANRVYGADEAGKKGAIATLVRSLTFSLDTFPRPGNMRYKDPNVKIPAFAISTYHANILEKKLQNCQKQCIIELSSEIETDDKEIPSHNAIAEINGNHSNKIILAGAHIDCWYNTQGAHDNASGCVQVMEIIRIFKEIGYTPKNKIRIVIFMDEEIDQRGSKKYALESNENNEIHMAAIESDMGGFAPIGFTVDAHDTIIGKLKQFEKIIEKFTPCKIRKGFGGVDIYPLKKYQVPLLGLEVVPFRYFEYQHSANDTYDKVNIRELKQGAALITSLIYLIDKYGL